MGRWNQSDLDALRKSRGRGGIQYVELIPGMPEIGIDLSGVDELLLCNKIGNPLLARAFDIYDKTEAEKRAQLQKAVDDGDEDAQTELDAMDAEAAAKKTDLSPVVPYEVKFWEDARQKTLWQDDILASIIIDPPWCRMDDLPPGGTPEGKLCIFDLTPEQRRLACDMAFSGVSALESFRKQATKPIDPLHVQRIRKGSKRLPHSDVANAS